MLTRFVWSEGGALSSKASAGTGKSFLLKSVYLWCLLNKFKCKAAAPTGIAAANVEVAGTDVCATTIHSLFDLDGDTYKTKLDFAKKCPKAVSYTHLTLPTKRIV